MIVINPNGEVDPVQIGPIEVIVRRAADALSPRSAWMAVAYWPGSARVLVDGWGPMPDDAVREVQDRIVTLRDALVLACMDLASVPGCGGEEMMPIEADEEAA